MKKTDTDIVAEVYNKFKLQFYRDVLSGIQNRELSLSTVEVFSVEIIAALGNPTINEFAEYCHISSPNATYKINCLIQKGYVNKVQSKQDKREYKLEVTEKYYKYYAISQSYVAKVLERVKESSTDEEYGSFIRMFQKMSDELMPEVDLSK